MTTPIRTIAVLALAALLTGHEQWLEADRFFYRTGETASIHVREGENFIGRRVKPEWKKLQRLEWLSSEKTTSLKPRPAADTLLSLVMTREGTQLLVMQGAPTMIRYGGEAFEAVLHDDGLDEILYARRKDNLLADSAREMSSHHAKVLLQVGAKTSSVFNKVCGLPIEIIPEKNPYDLRRGDPIRFLILFRGKPLFGAKVKVWIRHNQRTTVQNIFSQQDGMIETHVSNPGVWMVSVVKMLPGNAASDYESFSGSLVFGVK